MKHAVAERVIEDKGIVMVGEKMEHEINMLIVDNNF